MTNERKITRAMVPPHLYSLTKTEKRNWFSGSFQSHQVWYLFWCKILLICMAVTEETHQIKPQKAIFVRYLT